MMPQTKISCGFLGETLTAALLLFVILVSANAQENSQPIADRYEQMLVRSPQPGMGFDKVVEWYASGGGGLEILQKRWETATTENPDDAGRYLILRGLLAERLRATEEARAFYVEAMTQPGDPVAAAKFLAALETTEGRFPQAAAAYNQALKAEALPSIVRMELMRSLALLYQRSFDHKKAGEIWKEAILAFPGDPYVLEEAGEAFLEVGDYEGAREAFTALQKRSERDPFRRVAASLRLARTSELEGKTDEAVKTYELALEETSPGSWINREVRARIEELFRRKDDLPGLLAYYERRTAAVPGDYEAMASQAAVLADLGKGEESLARLQEACNLAPGETRLRFQLIRQLESQVRVSEAIAEAKELAKPAEASPEILTLLGELLWRTEDPTSRAEAIQTWKRLAPPDSKDPSRIAMLAEILSAKGEAEAALTEWNRLVEITPTASDARQKIARHHLEKGDKEAAKSSLTGLIEGDRATPENYLTLARLFSVLEFTEDSQSTIAEARVKFPTDSELLNFAWKQALESENAASVEALLPEVWAATENEFFAEDTIKRYAAFLEASGASEKTIKTLSENTEKSELQSSVLLALALATPNREVAAMALESLKFKSEPIRFARASSNFAMTFGTPEEQVASLRAVAAADPRLAMESLKSAAKILADSGKPEEALETISDLIDRSPADGSLYVLYADLAARSGRFDDATGRLQEGIRHVEDPSSLRLQLAMFLQVQGRTQDAAKALQEAFEAETQNSKRTEIFRRQIELAMQAGTLDDLVASLRAKQAREEGGSRYGAYLAEIFIMQDDYLSASEELAKTLGRNPDDPAAVSKLLDLAERGGDQDEALRLAARLAEIEPSNENRAGLIQRLFQSNEPERGLTEFQAIRGEVLKDPASWGTILMALRRAGFVEESNAVIAEIAAAKSDDPQILLEIANQHLATLNFEKAEQILWGMVGSTAFSEAVESVTAFAPMNPVFRHHSHLAMVRLQALQQMSGEIQNSMQMLFQPNRRSFGSRMRIFHGGMPQATSQADPNQRAFVKAWLMLLQLSRAQGTEEQFANKSKELFESSGLSVPSMAVLNSLIGDQERSLELLAAQAAKEDADIESDRLFLSMPFLTPQNENPDLKKIQERVAKADPSFALQQGFTKLTEIRTAKDTTPEQKKASLKEALGKMLEHPQIEEAPFLKLQLVSLAMEIEDRLLARKILDEVKSLPDTPPNPSMPAGFLQSQIQQLEILLLRKAILEDDKNSTEAFESALEAAASQTTPVGMPFGGGFYRGGRMANSLAQDTSDITIGDAEFPVMLFRAFLQTSSSPSDSEKIRTWFEKRVTPGVLDPYSVGLAYSDWFSSKREAAISGVEKIHDASPTPRSAAFLLEMYENNKAPENALAVIDLAESQQTETPDIRTLRKIRLLRATGNVAEAKDLAQKLIRNRLPAQLRENLRGELESLGIPTNQIPQFSRMRNQRSRRDPGDQIREQISKLASDNKKEEAERLASGVLQRPLPVKDDHQAANLRQNIINSLKSMDSLSTLAEVLETKLSNDPGDFDSALRLLEIDTSDNKAKAGERLVKLIEEHPDRVDNLAYAVRLLQNRSESKPLATKILCAAIRKDPDLLFKSGLSIEEFVNIASEPAEAQLLAETLAALDEGSFNRMFLPARLTGNHAVPSLLTQLAETCVQADKKELAILLLKRSLDMSLADMNLGLVTVMRLAELQLQAGDKEGAAASMRMILNSKSSNPRYGYMGGHQTIGNVLMNMVMNRMPGQLQENQLSRISELATKTGTLDELIKALEAQSPQQQGIGPALILKTSLDMPGVIDEWRQVLAKDSPPMGYINLPMMAPVIKALAKEKDAAKMIPALLEKIPQQSHQMGPDQSLAMLVETLPILKAFEKNPVVKRHMESLISGPMQDSNHAQYLPHSNAYTQALSTLVDHGYFEEARRLLDFTQGARRSRNMGNTAVFAALEARLNAIEGKNAAYQVLCVAGPRKEGKTPVFWKLTSDLSETTEPGNSRGVAWDPVPLPIPEKFRPKAIEIFAGQNPAVMKSVALLSKPGASGTANVDLPGDLGLMQARWTLPDGTKQWGSLSVYVQGENLIPNRGLPEGETPPGFQPDIAGPLGPKSAVGFQGLFPRMENHVPLATIEMDDQPALYVISGWLRGSSGHGQIPEVKIESLRKGGSKNSNHIYSSQLGAGQWMQVLKILTRKTRWQGASSLSDDANQLTVGLGLRSNHGHNSLWQIEAAWDGLTLNKIAASDSDGKVEEVIRDAKKAASDGDAAKACIEYLRAMELDPYQLLSQSGPDLWETFKKADKLDDLYAALSKQALYLPNPLHNNQSAMNNESLLNLLIQGAVADKPTGAAKTWLRQVADAPLGENQRFMVESAVLKEEAKNNPSAASPEKVLDLLGFSKEEIREERVRQLFANSSVPALDVVGLLDTPQHREASLKLLDEVTVPTRMLTAQKTLQAWLLAPDQPTEALKNWLESLAFRNAGENSVSFSMEADKAIFTRMARYHPQTGDVIAAINNWAASMRSSPEYQQQMISRMLYEIAASEFSQQEAYAGAWYDMELASLKSPNYSPPSDRIRQLTANLKTNGDWERISVLLALRETNSSLKSSSFQQEFNQLRDLAAMAKGDLSHAWPVTWVSGDAKSTTLHWQWNAKAVPPASRDFDKAISVSTKPQVETIPSQSQIEFLFGEMPNDLAVVAKAEGDASSGRLEAQLPAGNGFLRAVAIVNNQRIEGPLVPVLSGQSIFPTSGQTLTDLLTSGSKPLSAIQILDSGKAPDGSPAIKIDKREGSSRNEFEGPTFSVEAGKFYVLRAWVKRAGDGSVSLGTDLLPNANSKARRLNMVLTESREPTDQWVVHSRAVPVLSQHTRWVPFREVETARPMFSNVAPGTEIAGWELLEIADSKYGQWLTEIAMLQETASEAVKAAENHDGAACDPATLDKILALAAAEPLTAMEIHGSWLISELTKAGRPEVILPLYQAALGAEPNPLFPNPSWDNIFSTLTGLGNNDKVPEQVRWDAFQIVLAHADLLGVNQRLIAQRGFIELAIARDLKQEAIETVSADFARRLAEPDGRFLSDLFGNTSHSNERPVMQIIPLLDVASSDALTRKLLEALGKKSTIDPTRVEFLKLILEMTLPTTVVDKTWIPRIDAAFETTQKSTSPTFYMFGSSLLASHMSTKKSDPAVLLHLQNKALDRVLAGDAQNSSRQVELFRAFTGLAETADQTQGLQTLKTRMPQILEALAAPQEPANQTSLRLALRLLDALTALGEKESARAVLKIVENDVRKNARQREAFAKYLAPQTSETP
ncbi:MAG: tetratricopeptide repeat protein [Terrimicrobiaceae bacterium]